MTTFSTASSYPVTGRCSCGKIQYELSSGPMAVHCCHCTYCQRESGVAFGLNGLIENDRVTVLPSEDATVEGVPIPTPSGHGQTMFRCSNCKTLLWSNYGDPDYKFIRIGTICDNDVRCRKEFAPTVHIFTTTKLPWVDLSSEIARGVPIFEGFYKASEAWPKESLERLKVVREKLKAQKETEAEAGNQEGAN